MTRLNDIKAKDIPGSIYANKRDGRLIVQVKGKRVYTGLKDTASNRKMAENIKKNLYLELNGLKSEVVAKNQTLRNLFSEFKETHCINLSQKTTSGYTLAFNAIVKKDLPPSENLIENAVLQFLKNTKITSESINIYLRAFQVFLNWCSDRKYLPVIPIFKRYKQKITQKPVQNYSDDEIEKLINYFNEKDFEFSILLKLMLNTGMRIGECLRLERTQIKDDRILLKNKISQSAEFVLISPELRKLLLSLPVREMLFRWKYSSYSRLVRRFHDALDKCNIDRNNRSFHEFRKTYSTKVFQENTPLPIAQKLMRHKNINTTIKHYTKFNEIDLIDYQNKLQKKLQQ